MARERQYVNILAGVWLVSSAFLWPHSQAQFTNACAGGLLCAIVAALAGSLPRFRVINVGLGIWLLISAFWLPHESVATMANSIAVGLVVLAVSADASSVAAEVVAPADADEADNAVRGVRAVERSPDGHDDAAALQRAEELVAANLQGRVYRSPSDLMEVDPLDADSTRFVPNCGHGEVDRLHRHGAG